MKIELIRFSEEHIDTLLKWSRSKEFLFQWAGPTYKFPLDREQLKNDLDRTKEDIPQIYMFSAIDKDTKKVVGHLQIMNVDYENQYGHIGRVVRNPELHGMNIGTLMMKEVQRFGFEELGLHKLGLVVFDYNESAIKCYEKVGFIKEGVLRDSRRINGEYLSLVNMGILDREYFN